MAGRMIIVGDKHLIIVNKAGSKVQREVLGHLPHKAVIPVNPDVLRLLEVVREQYELC